MFMPSSCASFASVAAISAPIVVDEPPQVTGVDGSRRISSPLLVIRLASSVQRLARKPAYCRLACTRWFMSLVLIAWQNLVNDDEPQLKNEDLLSTHAVIWFICATENLVLPPPFCAHCWPQKPTVRGQLKVQPSVFVVTV